MQGWRSGESTRFPPMWPGFISTLDGVICGLGMLVLYSVPGGFFLGTPVFPFPQIPTFSIDSLSDLGVSSNLIGSPSRSN